MSSVVDVAREAWGENLPDWVEALAKECDRTSQRKAAQRINYSAGAVNTILRNRYNARTDGIETAIRGELMSETVNCHHIGVIGSHVCASWRAKRRSGLRANTLQRQMSRACGSCPLFPENEETPLSEDGTGMEKHND